MAMLLSTDKHTTCILKITHKTTTTSKIKLVQEQEADREDEAKEEPIRPEISIP